MAVEVRIRGDERKLIFEKSKERDELYENLLVDANPMGC
jgi:hypothetical protein